jgi:hypothetical protein
VRPIRGWLLLVGVLGAWASGCSEDESPAAATPAEPHASEGTVDEGPPASPLEPAPAAWRMVGDGPDRRRVPVEPGVDLVPDPDTGTTVDLRGGGRVEIAPRSHARLGAVAARPVLLGTGRARALLTASGPPDRAPLRVATPQATVELVRSGDVWVAALPDGRTWIAALAGHPTVVTGAVDAEGHLERWALGPGQALWVDADGPGEPAPGPTRAEEVTVRMDALVGGGDPAAGGAALGGAVWEAVWEAVEAALDDLEGELARGRALSEAHRGALVDAPGRATELRRQIVQHSKALLRLRARVLVRWERAAAQALAPGGPADGSGRPGRVDERVERALSHRP